MVIVALLFITILTTSVFIIAGSNTKQVVNQNDGMESYYIARSGAEATYQALFESPTMLSQFQTGNTVDNITITFDEGEAEVTIEGYDEGSTRRVRVHSIGKADGISVTRKSILEFDYVDFGNVKWSK